MTVRLHALLVQHPIAPVVAHGIEGSLLFTAEVVPSAQVPMLPASNADVGLAEGWETRQRTHAPTRNLFVE